MNGPGDDDDLFSQAASVAVGAPAKGSASGGADARKEVRVRVKWAARVQLPDGRVVDLQTFDISETGIGLIGQAPIASHAVLRCAIAIPDLNNPTRITPVQGTMKTAHVTVRGPDLQYGGIWVELEPAGHDLIKKWLRKLRS